MSAITIPSEDDTLNFIRNELRDEKLMSRKLKRDAELNRNRTALGDFFDDNIYNEDYVTEISKKLRKKTIGIQDYRKLQNALLQSKSNINAFFKVDNAIQGLIRDLSGTSAQSKLSAANCCCNLSLGDSKACTTICKFTAPYLIAELESTSQPLVEVCAWTIGNLAYGSDKAFLILHSQSCMKSLLTLVQQCSDSTLPAVTYAISRYIYGRNNSIDSADLIKLAQIIDARYSKVCDNDTIWLLAILSSNSACREYLISYAPAICNYLIESVSGKSQSVRELSGALRILCNTISEPSGQIAYCFLKDGTQEIHVLNNLLSHPHIHIRHETLWLLGNLYNHPLSNIQEITKSILSALPSLELAINSSNNVT